jgi:hypothetical protein
MDVPCMGCGKLDLIHGGGGGHEWEVKLRGWPLEVGGNGWGLLGCAHHVKECLQLQQLVSGKLGEVDRPWGSSMA